MMTFIAFELVEVNGLLMYHKKVSFARHKDVRSDIQVGNKWLSRLLSL